MWEELWDLPQSGALSACLLLLITSGAVINSVVYEKRLWCRYLCPIGAMNKMFATLSMTEVRTWKSNCEGCTTAECINGGSPTVAHDDYALKGCTMDLKNNQLRGKYVDQCDAWIRTLFRNADKVFLFSFLFTLISDMGDVSAI